MSVEPPPAYSELSNNSVDANRFGTDTELKGFVSFVVDNHFVGMIISKGGRTIHRLHEEYDVKIDVEQNRRNNSSTKVEVYGTKEATSNAEVKIMQLLLSSGKMKSRLKQLDKPVTLQAVEELTELSAFVEGTPPWVISYEMRNKNLSDLKSNKQKEKDHSAIWTTLENVIAGKTEANSPALFKLQVYSKSLSGLPEEQEAKDVIAMFVRFPVTYGRILEAICSQDDNFSTNFNLFLKSDYVVFKVARPKDLESDNAIWHEYFEKQAKDDRVLYLVELDPILPSAPPENLLENRNIEELEAKLMKEEANNRALTLSVEKLQRFDQTNLKQIHDLNTKYASSLREIYNAENNLRKLHARLDEEHAMRTQLQRIVQQMKQIMRCEMCSTIKLDLLFCPYCAKFTACGECNEKMMKEPKCYRCPGCKTSWRSVLGRSLAIRSDIFWSFAESADPDFSISSKRFTNQ